MKAFPSLDAFVIAGNAEKGKCQHKVECQLGFVVAVVVCFWFGGCFLPFGFGGVFSFCLFVFWVFLESKLCPGEVF